MMSSPQRHAGQTTRDQAGLSLIEVLVAAFLVATVAVFLAPLFVRAVASNIEGNEASMSINFDKGFLEQGAAMPIDQSLLDVRQIAPGAADDTVRRTLSLVYDTGPHDRGTLERELGDERWRTRLPPDEANASIELTWDFDLDLRDYSYFDIVSAQQSSQSLGDPADPGNPLTLIQSIGNPDVFDNPLGQAIQSPHRHLKEFTARVDSRRAGGPLGSSKITTAARMRSY